MPAGYVETVRFSLERSLEAPALSPRGTTPSGSRSSPQIIPLTEVIAPRIHRLAREVADTLGFCEEFALLQTRDFSENLNAQALTSDLPFAVRLIGPVAKLLSDQGLRAMLGHEFGHALAHRGFANHPAPPVARRAAVTPEGVVERWSVATELTADRFALLACQEVDATVHLELAGATGDSPEAHGVIAPAYLAHCVEQVERGSAELLQGAGTYPSKELRIYATWLFSRSDVYRDLVGRGPADLKLAAADEMLAKLLETAAPKAQAFLQPSAAARQQPGPALPPLPSRSALALPEEPAPDGSDLLLTLAWTAGERVGRLADRARESLRSLHADRPDDGAEPIDHGEADEDLAASLRRLEREEALDRSGTDLADDLERRFRELEERERHKK